MAALGPAETADFQWYTQPEIEAGFDAIMADLWNKSLGCDRYEIFINTSKFILSQTFPRL